MHQRRAIGFEVHQRHKNPDQFLRRRKPTIAASVISADNSSVPHSDNVGILATADLLTLNDC